MNMLSIVSNVLGLYGVSKFIFAQDKYTKPFQKTAIIKLIGLTNAFVFFWLLIGLLINLRNTDQLRFLRSRVSEHPHSKDSKSKEASSRKKAPKETLVTAAGPEEPTETVGKTKSKEVSLKDLVAKQIAGREAPLAKLTEFAKTSKESLGNDYYNAMTAKGKVTSISQYFSGVPKQDREVKIKSAALPGLKPDPALRAMAEEMQQKTIKKTKSTASVGSTGSDYYAAMIKEGKIPKIGSISQYGALLK